MSEPQKNITDKELQKSLNGVNIPALGFGTYQMEGEEAFKAVSEALEVGYRHIDTAQMYGNEKQVGKAIKESDIDREDLFITDKIWWENLLPASLKKSFHKSLENLQVNYIDLMLIHWPSPEGVPLKDSLEAMNELKEEGLIKHIGLSNFTPSLMDEALSHADIDFHQVEYHPFLNQKSLLKLAREHNHFLTAYSPLAQGRVVDSDKLAEIGDKYNKTAAQVALRWLIQQENVLAIPKASSSEHIRSNWEVNNFELDQDDMAKIHKMTSRNKRIIDPDFSPSWN